MYQKYPCTRCRGPVEYDPREGERTWCYECERDAERAGARDSMSPDWKAECPQCYGTHLTRVQHILRETCIERLSHRGVVREDPVCPDSRCPVPPPGAIREIPFVDVVRCNTCEWCGEDKALRWLPVLFTDPLRPNGSTG
jgi:hypothetical protein